MKRAGLFAVMLAVMVCAGFLVRSLWKSPGPGGLREFHAGELDENGRLIFLAEPRGVHKSLDYDYAMRVFYDDDVILSDEAPAPPDSYTIELYSQPDRKIWSARSVAGFRQHLTSIPHGTTLYLYNGGCAIPLFEDEAVLEQIADACGKEKLKLVDSEYPICTCPAW